MAVPLPGWLAWLTRFGWLLAALTGIVLYLPTLAYQFTYDDLQIIVENPRIRDLRQPARYLATSWWDEPGRGREYRPATMASFALNHAVSGLRPAGYHAVNIALHGAVCALLWLLVARLTGRRLLATVAALLFAIHPVHIEAVAGVVGRAELLVTFGFLLTLLAARASLAARGWAGRAGWALAVFPAAALAVFSKEHGVMLLPALPLLALFPPGDEADGWGERFPRGAINARLKVLLPALAAVALAVLLYLIARQGVLGSLRGAAASPSNILDNPLYALGAGPRLLTALMAVGHNALLLVAPFRPSPDYSLQAIVPVLSANDPRWLPGATVLLVALGGLYWLRHRPAALFGLSFLLLTFLISSNLIILIGTILAERLLYLPSAGFCLLIGALALGPDATLTGGEALTPGRWRVLGALGVWGVILIGQHDRYLPAWRDNDAISEYMVRRVPRSARARLAWAVALTNHGRNEEALTELRRALDIFPGYPVATMRLGLLQARMGLDQEALENLQRAFQVWQSQPQVAEELARLLTRQGKPALAESVLQQAMLATHGAPDIRLVLGLWLTDQQRWSEAAPILEALRPTAPPDQAPRLTEALARDYNGLGQKEKARALRAP